MWDGTNYVEVSAADACKAVLLPEADPLDPTHPHDPMGFPPWPALSRSTVFKQEKGFVEQVKKIVEDAQAIERCGGTVVNRHHNAMVNFLKACERMEENPGMWGGNYYKERKSQRRKSTRRKSTRRTSQRRKSQRRKSQRRKSQRRKSPRRKSPRRKSQRRG
jgi:hypothetical protein